MTPDLTLWIWSQISGHTSLYAQHIDELLPEGREREAILKHLKSISDIVGSELQKAQQKDFERRQNHM